MDVPWEETAMTKATAATRKRPIVVFIAFYIFSNWVDSTENRNGLANFF